jgi:hypothetical protein
MKSSQKLKKISPKKSKDKKVVKAVKVVKKQEGPIIRLWKAINDVLQSENMKKLKNGQFHYIRTQKNSQFSGMMDIIRNLLNSKEWENLEIIIDEIGSGKHNEYFANIQVKLKDNMLSEYNNFINEELVNKFIMHFINVVKSPEFIRYSNMTKYRECLQRSTMKYDSKMVGNILTCYDEQLHDLIKAVSTKEWYEFSDFLHNESQKLFHIVLKYSTNLRNKTRNLIL